MLDVKHKEPKFKQNKGIPKLNYAISNYDHENTFILINYLLKFRTSFMCVYIIAKNKFFGFFILFLDHNQ